MKEVIGVKLETLHRGVAIIFTTKGGEIVAFKASKYEARQLMLRLYRMLGMKRGDTMDSP